MKARPNPLAFTRKITFRRPDASDPEQRQEWLVTNGLGGYASGTISGVITRRYHGLLIAAMPAPLGRVVLLNELAENLKLDDGALVQLAAESWEHPDEGGKGPHRDSEFFLEAGLPVWRFAIGDCVVERRVLMPHKQNTVHVQYRLVAGPCSAALRLRPAMHFRPHEAPVSAELKGPYVLSAMHEWAPSTGTKSGSAVGLARYEVSGPPDMPTLRISLHGENTAFTVAGEKVAEVLYPVEESRGYEWRGELWTPGYFWVDIAPDRPATLTASTESWETIRALDPSDAFGAELERRRRLVGSAHPAARTGAGAELVLAADQFIITPKGRIKDAARAYAAGDDVRTVIAGYHWFTDWGRDTMISLEGLTLSTGRHIEARWILETFARYVRDGLIPNMFPEREMDGLYHTADATLWFFHAICRYLDATGDTETLSQLLPTMIDIVEHHVRGTRFGIGVDERDGLLRQGAPGYQLTWMDAKVGDWVVTPRRGKAVEINGLWYNALRLLEEWLRDFGETERANWAAGCADRARESFNRRFWYAEGGYLYDVVDGEDGRDDSSCRPNQLLAFSLRYPVLEESRWAPVLNVCKERLLTPVGLRSLAPGAPDYKQKYFGDLRSRDAAYHQGTVWAWLIGPFVDAWLKVHPEDRAGARRFVESVADQMGNHCIGSISEVFDAEAPYVARGCIAQAWSVAEALRCWIETAP